MELKEISPHCWELSPHKGMNVPGIIFSDAQGLASIHRDGTLEQIIAMASLPGIIKAAYAMPDFHCGYGFPIGGVAAFSQRDGIISPGGVGYDINCGVRLAGTALTKEDIRPRLDQLVTALFKAIPVGVGGQGEIKLSPKELKAILSQGSAWALSRGFGHASDLDRTEDKGKMIGADPSALSPKALERGCHQLGTLGSGNHFMEIGVVDQIQDEKIAKAFGLFPNQVTLMLHCGSRGVGHQICQDHLSQMKSRGPKSALTWAPIHSDAGQHYLTAMACAANFAWANRQVLLHLAREAFMATLDISPRVLGMQQIYDVSHNLARMETHTHRGKSMEVCVHRKGATRAFGPNHPNLAPPFIKTGQPILIPGDMGRGSYVMAGTQGAMDLCFGSTSHGAGRLLSRTAAKKAAKGRNIQRELANQGIRVQWRGKTTLAEEMPAA
ncbi:MAG: RtcB family protein, partial [Desulfovibrionales bacterium]|nr:RtcB family protein [Desulfovibrionales bacterium]